MANYNVASYNLIYIYAVNDEAHKGLLKIGQHSFSSKYSIAQLPPNCPTLNQNAHERILQQTRTALLSYELLYTELAVRTITMADGSKQVQSFQDKDVHDVMLNSGFTAIKFVESGRESEWYKIDFESAKAAIAAVKAGKYAITNTKAPAIIETKPKINLREEQRACVSLTISMFRRYDSMLWNCKMRFGKTVTAYELIKRQGYKKVIVITHRPAVEDSWGTDHQLMFEGTDNKFIDKTNGCADYYDSAIDAENDYKLQQTMQSGKAFVYFTSIQDLRGSKRVGGKYNKNNAVFDMDWDLLIIDEAHEGTCTDLGDAVIEALRKQNTKVLLLSGTPYNIMDKFDENKYTWTYVDEQNAKEKWEEEHSGERNPYEELPKMNIFTFDLSEQMPTSYRYVTEESAFNFREFFRTWTGDIERDFSIVPEGKSVGDFVYEEDVNNFLTLISREGEDSNYPFSTEEYRDMFAHTFWIVPGVKEAKALSALIQRHPNFQDYEVVNIAGDGDEEKPYNEALALVRSSIKSFPKTITISCGKLTTGVTVREWSAIMMLSGSASTSASGFMQAIFRVQSPGYINGKQKKNCYVFDFAPDRTLKVIAEAHNLNKKAAKGDEGAKAALGKFINFCPIISVEGTVMRSYDVDEMMRQIKRISVDSAINSGFDDDTIYLSDVGMKIDKYDQDILRKLSDVVAPQKKGKKQTEVVVTDTGMTNEQREIAKRAKHKPKRELSEEEKLALELYKKQKEEQKKMFNLLRAVSIRLPLLFYGADADITEIIHLQDFVRIVDDESWEEFMPKGLRKELFLDILRYYDADVVIGAGLRIRKMAKAADELPPTYRAKRIVEIMSKFKNPDKETVLTPWRVVNMHMGSTLGGYNFFDDDYQNELEEPRVIDNGEVTADVFLNSKARVLEMNSKSGLYPLYLAYSFYMLNVSGEEKDLPLETTQKIWFETLDKHIFVLCKTKMARMITIRTLAGYSNTTVHAIYLTKLVEERMKDLDRLSKKLTNPDTWNIGGDRMKFDAVVGNPPYQEAVNSTVNDKPLYHLFMDAGFILSDKVSFITPARFLFNAGATPASWNEKMLSDDHFKVVYYTPNSTDIFPNVDIKGGVAITFRDSNKYFGKIGAFCSFKELNNIKNKVWAVSTTSLTSIILNRGQYRFSDRVYIEHPEEMQKASDRRISTSAFERMPKLFTESKPDDTYDYIQMYGNIGNNRVYRWFRKDYLAPINNLYKYKVMLPKANGSGSIGEVLSTPLIGSPLIGYTETYISIGETDSKMEAEAILKYVKSKFARALLGILKVTQDNTKKVWAYVPMQDFTENSDIDWSKSISEIDRQLYKKYNLSEEEIDFIETKVKPME